MKCDITMKFKCGIKTRHGQLLFYLEISYAHQFKNFKIDFFSL